MINLVESRQLLRAREVREPGLVRSGAVVLVAVVISLATAALIPASELFAAVPIALMAIPFMLRSPMVRLTVIVFGGLLTLQSNYSLTVSKLVYLLACAGCTAVILVRVQILRNDPFSKALRPLLINSGIWGLVFLISIPVAVRNGISPMALIRGIIPYALMALVPLVAIDAGSSDAPPGRYRDLQTLFLIVSVITGLSWFIAWSSLRGYATEPTTSRVLWSFSHVMVGVTYCWTMSMYAKISRLVWLIGGMVLFLLVALTGTRLAILILIPPMVQFVFLWRHRIRSMARLIGMLVPALAVAAIASTIIVSTIDVDFDTIFERFTSLDQITNTNTQDGKSYEERATVTNLTIEAFKSSPLTGVSPGYEYHWLTPTRQQESGQVNDSPFLILGQFGLIGGLALIHLFYALGRVAQNVKTMVGHRTPETDTVLSLVPTLVIYCVGGPPMQDKGLSYAFMVLIAMLGLNLRSCATSALQKDIDA